MFFHAFSFCGHKGNLVFVVWQIVVGMLKQPKELKQRVLLLILYHGSQVSRFQTQLSKASQPFDLQKLGTVVREWQAILQVTTTERMSPQRAVEYLLSPQPTTATTTTTTTRRHNNHIVPYLAYDPSLHYVAYEP